VECSFECGYRRFAPRWNEEVVNFEDEILLRRVDCNIPTLINKKVLIRVKYLRLLEIILGEYEHNVMKLFFPFSSLT
jgi:hypothetical protein